MGVDIRPDHVTLARGEDAMFNCSGSAVGWVRNVATAPRVTAKLFDSPNTWYYENHRNKFDVVGEYNLIVYNVDASSDAGRYQCDRRGSSQFFAANLVVIGIDLVSSDSGILVLVHVSACVLVCD